MSGGDNIGNTGEFELIELLTEQLEFPESAGVEVGPGDDAAVLVPNRGARLVATADLLVQDVHFSALTPPFFTGWRTLAASLSDLAAMGAVGRWFLVTMALPEHMKTEFVRDFYRGLRALAQLHDVHLVGGDVTSSRQAAVFDLLALGEIAEGQRSFRRSTAQPGDWVVCTGHPGDSAAGLELMLQALETEEDRSKTCWELPDDESSLSAYRARLQYYTRTIAQALAAPVSRVGQLLQRHLLPLSRLAEVKALRRDVQITAVDDISDGVAREAREIAEASGVDLELSSQSYPISEAATWAAGFLGTDARQWFLNGGEDYELLLTCEPLTGYPSHHRGPLPFEMTDITGEQVPVTVIGEIKKARTTPKVWQSGPNGREPLDELGFTHF
jgi:thiamine-monophosphate kinase